MTSTTTLPASRSGNLNFVLICVFIDMLGIGLIVPVLPALVGEFVHGREQQALWYGVLGATFGLMQFLFMPMVGAISDRLGRRPVLLYSMAGMGLNFLATAWAPSLAWLFIGRVIGGASSASMSVASAYASDVSRPEDRAKSFGKIGAAFGLGFVCGPMLGGLLGNVSLHLPFYVAAGLSAANFVYGFVAVPESLPPGRRAPFRLADVHPFGGLARLAKRQEIRGLVIVYTLVTFAQMMLQSTWVLYTTFRFDWTPRDNGIAMFCVGVASIVVQAGLLAVLIRRFGEVRLSLLGLASGAITYMLYGLATQGWMMYVFILCNLLAFAAGPALQGIISKAGGAGEQGELMGSLQSVGSLGVTQCAYYLLLIEAYRSGEMSHAYPIMRGSAPLLVALINGPLTGEGLRPPQWLAMGLICGGVLALGLLGPRAGMATRRRSTVFALATACVIALYTLIDGLGVRRSGAPAAYTMWIFLLTGLAVTAWTARRHAPALLGLARTRPILLPLGGVSTVASYGIALWAMTLAPVAAIAALRETSILFATGIAALLLRERIAPARWAAVALIACGAVAMRLA